MIHKMVGYAQQSPSEVIGESTKVSLEVDVEKVARAINRLAEKLEEGNLKTMVHVDKLAEAVRELTLKQQKEIKVEVKVPEGLPPHVTVEPQIHVEQPKVEVKGLDGTFMPPCEQGMSAKHTWILAGAVLSSPVLAKALDYLLQLIHH